jgi:hypothetical protein
VHPTLGSLAAFSSIFLRLSIFPVGRRSAARPSAGNANRWAADAKKKIMNIKVYKMDMIDITRKYILPTGLVTLIIFALSHIPKTGIDFNVFYLAGRAVWDLKNPYTASPGFYSAPWMLVILAPISLLKHQTARWVWFALGIICYITAFKRLKISNLGVMILLLNPFIYFDLMLGNYNWLILLGATLPAAVGSWFVILKPQMSIVLFGLWLKQRRWTALIPMVVLAVLFILKLYTLPNMSGMYWSTSLWPYGIPVGIALAWFGMKRDDTLLVLAAAPFLAPYVGVTTWTTVLLPLTRNKFLLSAGVLVSWVIGLYLVALPNV